jgi:hypothetical protein
VLHTAGGGVPGVLCAVLPEVFYDTEIAAHKKGGANDLGKLREQFLPFDFYIRQRFFKK